MQASRATVLLKFGAVKSTEALSLVAAVFLLVLLLVMNYPSTGVVRGDDEGSGIGGTGRAAQPGSGLGGTGLKPFLGLSTQNEVEILLSPQLRDSAITEAVDINFQPGRADEHTLVEPLFKLVAATAITHDSSPITIAESIQRASDNNPIYFQQLQEISDQLELAEAHFSVEESSSEQSLDLLNQPLELAVASTAGPGINGRDAIPQTLESAATGFDQPKADDSAASWKSFTQFLAKSAQSRAGERSTAAVQEISVTAESTNGLSRPEKMRRPELPPVQRLRPIQRASILPPRIQPLRL